MNKAPRVVEEFEEEPEEWERRFDERFAHIYKDKRDYVTDLDYMALKSFIRATVSEAKEKGYKLGVEAGYAQARMEEI